MAIKPQQKQFFETFGYLVLPGLVKAEIEWITAEFEAVFRDRGVVHDGSQRSVIVPFIDQRPRLCTLLDLPAIVDLISGLIGDNFNYLGGDGNVPAIPLESQPGDVVAFNHNLMHAAFGGSKRRRMFTMNSCAHCQTPEEIQELENFIAGKARFWVDQSHSAIMRTTAPPQRLRFLQQVIDHEGHLPALAAKARLTMSEPARG